MQSFQSAFEWETDILTQIRILVKPWSTGKETKQIANFGHQTLSEHRMAKRKAMGGLRQTYTKIQAF